MGFLVCVVCDNNGHGTLEPEEAVAHLLPFYLAPWAMFPVFSLPCRLCPLLRCFLKQRRGSYIFFHPPTVGRAFLGASGGLDGAEYLRGTTWLWELRTQCVVKQLLPSIDLYFGWSGRAMRASLLQPCASCSSLTAPELVRPLPVKAKFRSGAVDFAIATWCYLVVACLGGLFYAPGWFGPSLWRSSSDLGPRALHYHVVAESFADCLTGAGVARVSPAGDWHASVVRWDVPSCCSPPILC